MKQVAVSGAVLPGAGGGGLGRRVFGTVSLVVGVVGTLVGLAGSAFPIGSVIWRQGWVWVGVLVIIASTLVLGLRLRGLTEAPASGPLGRIAVDGTAGLHQGWVAVLAAGTPRVGGAGCARAVAAEAR